MKNTMMKKFFVGLFSLLMGVGSAFAQTNMSSEMYDLASATAVSAVMTVRATTVTT